MGLFGRSSQLLLAVMVMLLGGTGASWGGMTPDTDHETHSGGTDGLAIDSPSTALEKTEPVVAGSTIDKSNVTELIACVVGALATADSKTTLPLLLTDNGLTQPFAMALAPRQTTVKRRQKDPLVVPGQMHTPRGLGLVESRQTFMQLDRVTSSNQQTGNVVLTIEGTLFNATVLEFDQKVTLNRIGSSVSKNVTAMQAVDLKCVLDCVVPEETVLEVTRRLTPYLPADLTTATAEVTSEYREIRGQLTELTQQDMQARDVECKKVQARLEKVLSSRSDWMNNRRLERLTPEARRKADELRQRRIDDLRDKLHDLTTKPLPQNRERIDELQRKLDRLLAKLVKYHLASHPKPAMPDQCDLLWQIDHIQQTDPVHSCPSVHGNILNSQAVIGCLYTGVTDQDVLAAQKEFRCQRCKGTGLVSSGRDSKRVSFGPSSTDFSKDTQPCPDCQGLGICFGPRESPSDQLLMDRGMPVGPADSPSR